MERGELCKYNVTECYHYYNNNIMLTGQCQSELKAGWGWTSGFMDFKRHPWLSDQQTFNQYHGRGILRYYYCTYTHMNY